MPFPALRRPAPAPRGPSGCGRWCARRASPPDRLIYPLFVVPGRGVRSEISSLPGCFHLSVDEAAREAREVEPLGIAGVILFGLPEGKDPQGTQGYAEDGVVQRAVRAIRKECQELLVVTDVCLCEYTSHGHCGVVEGEEVRNDPTLDLLARMAVSHARAGAHVVAPSDMMDGRVGAIRRRPRRPGFAEPAHPFLRGQVRLRVLRPVPRGGRLRAAVRRPPRLPDGPAERARGPARGAARRGGRRGHGHGQARAALPRRDPRGARELSTCRWPPTTSRASTRW